MTNDKSIQRAAHSVRELQQMKFEVFPFDGDWLKAFDRPERRGVWLVWGNSGNGKTSFVMSLCKYLCQFGRVAYDSLEEGTSLTMIRTLERFQMMDVNNRFLLINNECMEALNDRLHKRKSPDIVVIDSFQYTQMNFASYKKFRENNMKKLIIIISHSDGKLPAGRSARSVMFNADLKIYVEGYRAFSKGRYIGARKYYDIWPEEAEKYWGNKL